MTDLAALAEKRLDEIAKLRRQQGAISMTTPREALLACHECNGTGVFGEKAGARWLCELCNGEGKFRDRRATPEPAAGAVERAAMSRFQHGENWDKARQIVKEHREYLQSDTGFDLADKEHHAYEGLMARIAAALASVSAPPGWQPIETAPKHCLILVWAPEREGLPAMFSMCRWHPDAGFCIDELREPTHWQPLPAPPAAAVKP